MTFNEILQSFPAASDYLASMYLIRRDEGVITNSKLATWLKVSRSAVSQAVNRLRTLKLISQERYADIILTENGEHFAKKILRRHYLLEHFLMKHLNMTWDEIDVEAKHLQNNISDKFEEQMYHVAGMPRACPHGNPIPGSEGEQEILKAPPISEAAEGSTLILVRITERGEETEGLLSFTYSNAIEPGTRLTIIAHTPEGSRVMHESKGKILIPAEYTPYLRYRQ